MFRKLKGRRVVISTAGPESFRGTVLSVGLFYVRLSPFDVITETGTGAAEGIARIPRRTVTWIQEL
jgi:hypothetical protein